MLKKNNNLRKKKLFFNIKRAPGLPCPSLCPLPRLMPPSWGTENSTNNVVLLWTDLTPQDLSDGLQGLALTPHL